MFFQQEITDAKVSTSYADCEPGEEARLSNVYACVHDQCSLVCAHLAFVGGLKGCKLRIRIQHLSMNKYIPLVFCDFNFKY